MYPDYFEQEIKLRLTMHLGNGAIKHTFQQTNDMTLITNNFVGCNKWTRQESDVIILQITQAVMILSDDPLINRQDTGKTCTLKNI